MTHGFGSDKCRLGEQKIIIYIYIYIYIYIHIYNLTVQKRLTVSLVLMDWSSSMKIIFHCSKTYEAVFEMDQTWANGKRDGSLVPPQGFVECAIRHSHIPDKS